MFSLKEWNFEEYKAAVKEIEDPVDRLDELNAMRSYAFIEEMESHRVRMRSEEDLLISQRFDLFLEWVDEEIKSMKVEFADLIKEREKKAWKGHVRLPYPVVWDRDSYNKIEPEVREKGKKREWIECVLINLNEGKISEKEILLDSGLKGVEENLSSLLKVPKKLIEKTNNLFLGSNEEGKAERLDLLNKTRKFADLQAQLATNITQEQHLGSEIAILESQISHLKEQISSNKDPLGKLEKTLEEFLKSRLLVEENMTSKRKSIDHSSDQIRNIEKDRLEKEQK